MLYHSIFDLIHGHDIQQEANASLMYAQLHQRADVEKYN